MRNEENSVVISVSGGLGDMIGLLPLFTQFRGSLIISDFYRDLFLPYNLDVIWWEEKKGDLRNIAEISLLVRRRVKPEKAYGTYPNGRRINLLLALMPCEKIFYDDGNYNLKRFVFLPRILPKSRPIRINFPEKRTYRELNAGMLGLKYPEKFDFLEIPEFREEAEKFSRIPYAVIHPTAKYRTKRWDFGKYLSVSEKILSHGFKLVFVFGKEDRDEAYEVVKRFGTDKAKILLGENINKVISFVKRAKFLLGNDSAIAQISGLAGIKTFVIYGYTRYYHTSPPNAEVIRVDLPCSPCYNFAKGEKSVEKECRYNIACLREIPESMVWERIKRFIDSL